MALCNPRSYPLNPCTPNSDSNAPQGQFTGGGSSFLEVQFYPPGEAPFFDNVSCDNTHWCASLHINDLECTFGFDSCNANCEEPTNFAFIQKNGVPTGPPSPQEATLADVHAEQPDAAHEPGRPPQGPHLRRTGSGGWSRARSASQRPDDRADRLHAGVGCERLRGDRNRGLHGQAVQLRARVQRLPRSRTSCPGPRCRPTSAPSSRSVTLTPCTEPVESGDRRAARLHGGRPVLAHLQRTVRVVVRQRFGQRRGLRR